MGAGESGVKTVHGDLPDGPQAGKDIWLDSSLFTRNGYLNPGQGPGGNSWAVDPEKLEK